MSTVIELVTVTVHLQLLYRREDSEEFLLVSESINADPVITVLLDVSSATDRRTKCSQLLVAVPKVLAVLQ